MKTDAYRDESAPTRAELRLLEDRLTALEARPPKPPREPLELRRWHSVVWCVVTCVACALACGRLQDVHGTGMVTAGVVLTFIGSFVAGLSACIVPITTWATDHRLGDRW